MPFHSESLRRTRLQLRITPAGLSVIAAAAAMTAGVLWLVSAWMSRSRM